MLEKTQIEFVQTKAPLINGNDWTFRKAKTRELTHCYHDYPARMIPQIAGKLLDLFGHNAGVLFDPYCGTGTSLVEANIRGINSVGTDLNPLARLIARAKTTPFCIEDIENLITKFNRLALGEMLSKIKEPQEIYGITNLSFWFKPEVIQSLLEIRSFIKEIKKDTTRLFFQIAFSETVRESSNTRNGEFKLYRYSKEKLEKFSPDVYGIMVEKLQRNFKGAKQYKAIVDNFKRPPFAKIYGFNSGESIPPEILLPGSVDLVITSPPYGDSRTTVAYGQYSRLSAAWLELEEPAQIDRNLMGGSRSKKISNFPSEALNEKIEEVRLNNEKRALEVVSFYDDLYDSMKNVAKVIKSGGYSCYVVGNRKVAGIILPTDIVIKDFFENFGMEYVETFTRSIPNKRMPSKNSPSNKKGILESTMTKEYIVVMQKV